MSKTIIKYALTLATTLLVLATSGLCKNYVSFDGGFYITYPDNWYQVDYNTVDAFLARANAGKEMFNYDAVFAPDSSKPFFANSYFFISLEKVGELSQHQIDSVLKKLSGVFGKGIKYFPVGDFMSDIKSNAPNYDKKTKVVTILNNIVQGQKTVKKNLIMMKFYNKGIASFYFYFPDSLFAKDKQIFEDVITSFSTKDIDKVIPHEQAKVANLKGKIKTTESENSYSEKSRTILLITAFVVISLIMIAIFRRKRKR
ncbi:MAG: hypothetical protein GXO93_08740 [FCB group bacterium]|nr:hypothetical protein [FCB group bacterium]